MKIRSLTCENCGAPLEIPARNRHAQCEYCGSRLQIDQSGAPHVTEGPEEQPNAKRLAAEVRALRGEKRLERLDREWTEERRRYLSGGKKGLRVPSIAGSALGGCFATAFGIVWMVIAAGISGPFALFGLVFIGMAVLSSAAGITRATKFRKARKKFDSKRHKLVGELMKWPRWFPDT